MKIYILGTTPQDKGKQLENLTEKILESLNYKSITKREISVGGHEIDLKAKKEEGIIKNKKQINLICECKAHIKPTNMTDWLKFLGKVYLEESKTNEEIYACFISLYGVNGNVTGSFEDLKIKKSNIEIITGEDLFEIVKDIYNLIDLNKLKNNICKYTNKSILNTSMIYYNELYWLIEFSDDYFTILDSKGNDVQQDNNLSEMAKDFANGKFTNIVHEKEKNDIIELYEKFITLILIESNIKVKKDTLLIKFKEYLKESKKDFIQNYFEDSINKIQKNDFLINNNDSFSLSLDTTDKQVSFYKFLLHNIILLKILNTDFYQKYIDKNLIDKILSIQYDIKLTPDEKVKLLQFIKLSPTSLNLVLQEIDLITCHRKELNLNESIESNDKNILFMLLHQSLEKDFNEQSFKDFYYLHNNIKELEVEHSIKLKSKKSIVLENKNKKRLGIGEIQNTNQLIQVYIFDESPEPWEK